MDFDIPHDIASFLTEVDRFIEPKIKNKIATNGDNLPIVKSIDLDIISNITGALETSPKSPIKWVGIG